MPTIEISPDGFYIIDDQGNKRLFNDNQNDPVDQISAWYTMREIARKYTPQIMSGNNPIILDYLLWADIKGAVGKTLTCDYDNVRKFYEDNNWQKIVDYRFGLSVYKHPEWPQKPILAVLVGTTDCGGHTVYLHAHVSPVYQQGYQLMGRASVNLNGYFRVLKYEINNNGFTIIDEKTQNSASIEWSELGIDPIITSTGDYETDLNANITTQGGEVKVTVDNEDLLQTDQEVKASFIALLNSLYPEDKGNLFYPGLPLLERFKNPGDPDQYYYQLPNLVAGIKIEERGILAKAKGWCYDRGIMASPEEGIPSQTSYASVHDFCDTCCSGYIKQGDYVEMCFGNNDTDGRIRVSCRRLATMGLCIAAP